MKMRGAAVKTQQNAKFGPFRTTTFSQRKNPEKLSPTKEKFPIHPLKTIKNK